MRLIPEESETIAGAARQLRQRQTTSRQLIERCLARIDEWEPLVQAWVSIDRDGALTRAEQLDAELRAGDWRGPLHGIPIGIKDIVDIAGLPTAAGSKRLANALAAKDATVVRKLREAGAILLGKTVTTQFACFDPPPTRNPWNVNHTPGGSSSGSAAAVATGMCLGAIGSQTGGSITRPAAYCGVAGCKPSYGRVSLTGIVPLAPSMDHPGPIARCVRDLAILLDVISGHDPADPHSIARNDPALALFDVEAATISPPQMSRLRGFFESGAEPQMLTAFETALARFRSAGAAVGETPFPLSFAAIYQQHRTRMAFETAAFHKDSFRKYREDYLPKVASIIAEGLEISESTYQEARRHQAQSSDEIGAAFGDADVILCPAAPGPAPDLSTTGDPSFNSPWSHTGLPTICFPIGLTEEGLPLGIQLVGRRFDEARLFRAALWCEETLRASAK